MGKGWAKRYAVGDIKLVKYKGSWAADFIHKGKRQRTKLVKLSRPEQEARLALNQFAEIRRAVIQTQKTTYTIADLWKLWLEDRERDGLDNKIYSYQWVSLAPFFGYRTPDLLTKEDCQEYAQKKLASGKSTSTIHTELNRLRACLSWAYKYNKIPKPIYVWSPSAGKPRNVVLTVDEANRLLEASKHSDPHIRLFVVLLFMTSGRHRAILDLTWDRVNFEEQYIDLDDGFEPNPMHRNRRKGRAKVWMSLDAKKELELAYSGRTSKWVIEHGGKPLKSCREGFASAVKRAGIKKKVTPHTIRHTLATWAFRLPTKLTSTLLGHKNVRTTEIIYQHPDHVVTQPVIEEIERLLGAFAPSSKE